MKTLQYAGGVAAITESLVYIVGFAVMATLLNPGDTTGWDAQQKLAFMIEHKTLFQYWMLFVYIVGGAGLAVLAVAVHERFKSSFPGTMQVATAFGLIWSGLVIASGMIANHGLDSVAALYPQNAAQAAGAWLAIGAVQDGIGGSNEIVGGIWMLLISLVALRARRLPLVVSLLGLFVGAAGILSSLPGLGDLSAVFGITQIPWFAAMGYQMLRTPR